MAAANFRIGVARAAFSPSLTLTGADMLDRHLDLGTVPCVSSDCGAGHCRLVWLSASTGREKPLP